MSKLQKKESLFQRNQGTEVMRNPYLPIPQKMDDDPRYFYIRVMDIYNLNSDLADSELKLTFVMSTKSSVTKFKTGKNRITSSDKQRLRNETHLFCYQAEQVLKMQWDKQNTQIANNNNNSTIQKPIQSSSQNIKTEKKEKRYKQKIQSGFSRVPITPFAVMPYTKHQVKIKFIGLKLDKKIQDIQAGYMDVEIYYFLKFEAKLYISPLHGKFTVNRANLDTIRSCCILTLNGQRKKSIIDTQRGIYPNWQSETDKLRKSGQIQDYSQQAISNKLSFNLNSVGHTLKLQVVNFPFFDKDAFVIGQTQIRIQSYDFLRVPNMPVTQNQQIKIYYTNFLSKQKIEAGSIFVRTQFIFDAHAIRKLADSDDDEQQR